MKRFLLMLMVLITVCCTAQAEIVGRQGDDYIHRFDAPNGQALYFVSREQDPMPRMADVNFDGVEDVVVNTFMGASNFGVMFFVWDGEAYVPVTHPGAEELVNYDLYPEAGIVATGSNDGYAGVLHTKQLWRWAGTDLVLARSAEGSTAETTSYADDITTVIYENDLVRITVTDHEQVIDLDGGEGMWSAGMSTTTTMLQLTVDLYDTEAVIAALNEEDRMLWEGLTP